MDNAISNTTSISSEVFRKKNKLDSVMLIHRRNPTFSLFVLIQRRIKVYDEK